MKPGILALLGGILIGLFLWLSQPARREIEVGPPAPTNAPSASRTASASYSRTRKPKVALPETPGPVTNSIAGALALLQDGQAPLAVRRRAAYDLVRIGTDESLDALERALPSLPPLVQAAAAEALGLSKLPRAAAMLLSMWGQANEVTARSIATALGRNGSVECLAVLRAALLDPDDSLQVRGVAAAGLGVSADADALKLLKETFAATRGTELAPQILAAIGERPFAETRDFFQQVLDAPGAEPELRLAALESLSDLPADAAEFLSKYLLDADPEIRSEAAWALSTTEDPGNAGPQILNLLPGEADAEVRLRLYQALGNQEGYDVNAALQVVRTEADAAARLAGVQALAGIEPSRATTELVTYLEQNAVPSLLNSALQGKDLSERLQAVMILQQINRPASQRALQSLSESSQDAAVQRALRGMH